MKPQESKTISSISRIWLYSDWNMENSSFDLMYDLEQIDEIIFNKKGTYRWEMIWDDNRDFESLLRWEEIEVLQNEEEDEEEVIQYFSLDDAEVVPEESFVSTEDINIDNSSPNISLPSISSDDASAYLCVDENETSWFSQATLDALLVNINNNDSDDNSNDYINNWDWNNSSNQDNSNEWTEDDIWETEMEITPWDKYELANDNDDWPCNEFFCITIDFITSNQKLLAWWNSYSIESFINTSNGHLKKFSATSLVQSQMTTNNFELWLSNLNLADSFHMWIVLVKKTPPLLKVEKEWVDAGEKFKERLREYYKNNSLEYDKRNSLQVFKDTQNEQKLLNMSWERPISTVPYNNNKLLNKQALDKDKNRLLSKEVDKKILHEDMDKFYQNFIGIESFTKNIFDYTKNVSAIIKWMKEIPSK